MAVDIIETIFVYVDFREEMLQFSEFAECVIITDDFRETVCDTRCSATAFCDFMRFIISQLDAEDFCRSFDYLCEVCVFVEIHLPDISESVTKWMAERWETSGCTDECKFRQIHFNRCRTRATSDHDIYLIVFHRGIEDFFYDRLETVDFIDKEYITRLETREHGEHIRWFINCGSWSMTETRTCFSSNEHGKCRLSESWRAVEEDMFDIGISDFCGIQSDLEVFFYHGLPDIIREFFRTQRLFPTIVRSCHRFYESFVDVFWSVFDSHDSILSTKYKVQSTKLSVTKKKDLTNYFIC